MNKRNLATALPNRIKKKREFFRGVNNSKNKVVHATARPNANLKHPLTFTIPFSLSPMGFMVSPPGDNLFLQGTCRGVVAVVREEEIFSVRLNSQWCNR
jgi:hypothetical protein